MKRKVINIMRISETHCTGQGKVQLAEGDTIIYFGKDDDNHRQGVGILMSKSAVGTLMEWTPISERIIQARYYSNYLKLTVIHACIRTNGRCRRTRLQDVIDSYWRNECQENEEPEVEEEEEVERDIRVMKKAHTEAAETVLGRPQKKKKP
ncbi:uncharacterized protein [Montipora foliosa]|uniref:uncharacterized protein n=1 Tax=Montipora foliosa TaxID=591990 RepID=UPI0035F1D36E